MQNKNHTGQILVTGTTVTDLLSQIGQLLDAKFSTTPKTTEGQSGYLSRKDVAALLKITLPTLHDWTKLGLLKSYKLGTRVLYKEAEVITALEGLFATKHKKGVSHG